MEQQLKPLHKNNFGLLRLILASLVVVSHSSEMLDGNRSREALTSLGSAVTFGELAVDGFFIISGYLVLQSFEKSATILDYLKKRILRIYPGFIVCAVLVIASSPFIGAQPQPSTLKDCGAVLLDLATLNWPHMAAYPDLHFHSTNGSAWSIVYEFRCYLMVILLGFLMIFRNRFILLVITASLIVSHMVGWPTYLGPIAKIVGLPQLFIRMAGFFCVGMCFYSFRDTYRFDRYLALSCAVALAIGLASPLFAETCFAVFGAYLLFWFALGLKSEFLAEMNNRNDISYGTYLYAWPISAGLIYFFSIVSPISLFLLTLPLALLAGFLSWHLVEKRAVSLGKRAAL